MRRKQADNNEGSGDCVGKRKEFALAMVQEARGTILLLRLGLLTTRALGDSFSISSTRREVKEVCQEERMTLNLAARVEATIRAAVERTTTLAAGIAREAEAAAGAYQNQRDSARRRTTIFRETKLEGTSSLKWERPFKLDV
jgi:hypothetical protein